MMGRVQKGNQENQVTRNQVKILVADYLKGKYVSEEDYSGSVNMYYINRDFGSYDALLEELGITKAAKPKSKAKKAEESKDKE